MKKKMLWIWLFAASFALGCMDKKRGVYDPGPELPWNDSLLEVPLDLANEHSPSLALTNERQLTLEPAGALSGPGMSPNLWIANTEEGTVSKIDTDTGKELARYRSGPGYPDPSRTTVGLNGDVVVANRTGSSAIRIHADPKTCPDRNKNGRIDTSAGPDDVRPWGQDECVLWHTQFAEQSLARGAAFDFRVDEDGAARVWIGLYNPKKLVELNADTGKIENEVTIDGNPYGLAFDGTGNLWAFCHGNDAIVRLDPRTQKWEAIRTNGCGYGITTDSSGNVWVAGSSCVGRYNPASGEWVKKNHGSQLRGIAVDGKGSVWIADTSFGVREIDADTLEPRRDLKLEGSGFIGVAVDHRSRVWVVSQDRSTAFRIDPATLLPEAFPTGRRPYTYSDMTGFQLQNAAPPQGFYRVRVDCGVNGARWERLHWEGKTPEGTSIQFRVRVGDDPDTLGALPYRPAARQPGDRSPAELDPQLTASGGHNTGRYLELEVILSSSTPDAQPLLESARLQCSKPQGI